MNCKMYNMNSGVNTLSSAEKLTVSDLSKNWTSALLTSNTTASSLETITNRLPQNQPQHTHRDYRQHTHLCVGMCGGVCVCVYVWYECCMRGGRE